MNRIYFLLSVVMAMSAGSAAQARMALVYSGSGVCEEGCALAAANIALRAGFYVKYVDEKTLTRDLLKQASVWIQPGGNAIDLSHALSPQQKEWLRNFVHSGGGYLGFCAGAFFLDTKVDDDGVLDGLALLPLHWHTRNYRPPGERKAAILPVLWEEKWRYLYFEEGGSFHFNAESSELHPEKQTLAISKEISMNSDAGKQASRVLAANHGAALRVLAKYQTGEIAAIATTYGKGQVVATGLHPEALEGWRLAAGLTDPDGLDLDLADELFGLAVEAQQSSKQKLR